MKLLRFQFVYVNEYIFTGCSIDIDAQAPKQLAKGKIALSI
jgi:hypothetical protein